MHHSSDCCMQAGSVAGHRTPALCPWAGDLTSLGPIVHFCEIGLLPRAVVWTK